ncbi:MAG: shikimate kinase [Saprospiraceae bacterium]|nr:shikimate kinase [Saprospiraceae bacterium]
MQKPCFLVGFMGSGKTYLGQRLAALLALPFVDLDACIEAQERQTIASIFSSLGEPAFRQLEQQCLFNIPTDIPQVVATGGGTPCFHENMAWMNQVGVTIYLQTPVPVLAARLRLDAHTRPLLQGIGEQELEGHIAQILSRRAPYYEQAQIIAPFNDREILFLQQLVSSIRQLEQA